MLSSATSATAAPGPSPNPARPAGTGEGAGRHDGERGGGCGERSVGDCAAEGKRGSDDSAESGNGDTGGAMVGVDCVVAVEEGEGILTTSLLAVGGVKESPEGMTAVNAHSSLARSSLLTYSAQSLRPVIGSDHKSTLPKRLKWTVCPNKLKLDMANMHTTVFLYFRVLYIDWLYVGGCHPLSGCF